MIPSDLQLKHKAEQLNKLVFRILLDVKSKHRLICPNQYLDHQVVED